MNMTCNKVHIRPTNEAVPRAYNDTQHYMNNELIHDLDSKLQLSNIDLMTNINLPDMPQLWPLKAARLRFTNSIHYTKAGDHGGIRLVSLFYMAWRSASWGREAGGFRKIDLVTV